MRSLIIRTLTGILLLAVILPAIFFSNTFWGSVGFCVLTVALTVVAVVESAKCYGVADKWYSTVPLIILALAEGCFCWLWHGSEHYLFYAVAPVIVFILLEYIVCMFIADDIPEPLIQSFMLSLYSLAGFTALHFMSYMNEGRFYIFMVFIVSWTTDIFAYLIGRLFGKHPLAPKISPKKTIAGSVGGTIASTGLTAVYVLIFAHINTLTINYYIMIPLVLLLSCLSQFGDLLLSRIKRLQGIKDYGNILPGHGGVLDRFDSIIPIAMVTCLVFVFLGFFS